MGAPTSKSLIGQGLYDINGPYYWKQGSSKSTSVDGSEDADPAANNGTKKKGSRKAKGDIQPTQSSSRHKS